MSLIASMASCLRFSLLPIFAAALVLTACSDSPPGDGDDSGPCAEDSDCGPGGVCIAGQCFSTGNDAGEDVEQDPEEDVDEDPVDDPEEDVDEDADVDTGGQFGDPCDRDEECESGFCIETADGSVCTVPCTDSCPEEGWECRLLPGQGADLVRLCVPVVDDLCQPCAADIDCGGLVDLCLTYEDGTFCSRACESADDCAEGYSCDEVADGQGGFANQCVRELGICGDCLDRDGDGFGEGDGCLGFDCDDGDDSTYEGAPELCDGFDNDCDEIPDEGFNLVTDVNNCGGCGIECDLLRAAPICVDGACQIGSCLPGFFDRNGDPEDGCEYACTPNEATGGAEICNGVDDDCDGVIDNGFDLQSDAANCGACGNACALENADAMSCVEGTCVVDSCLEPFADCNGLDVDGCEVDTTSDDDHCGGCENECALPNAAPTCEDSVCVIDTCNEPWDHCDEDIENGCETNLLTDELNCGTCGTICDAAGGLGACSSGECTVDICTPGLADCDGLDTNGCEVDIDNDPLNCGACDFVCEVPNAVPACEDGRCTIAECLTGFYDINGLREDGCEYACTASGEELCDGVDNDCNGIIDDGFDLDSDIENCGACGRLCNPPHADGICSAGECVITRCELGFEDCNLIGIDGCETAVGFDPLNCGGCGVVCDLDNASAECFGRTCLVDECVAPWENCDTNPVNGCEANLDSSEAHCGTCFAVCSIAGGTGLCDEGTCGVGLCTGDLADCDGRVDNGCEVDLGSNPLNCGGCGVTCAAPNASTRCVDRGCELLSCDPGFRDCDGVYGTGCEVNINNSPSNCGSCGNVCDFPNADATCVAGSCALNSCDSNFANCDLLAGNGCETNLLTDPLNCGVCGESCEVDNGAGFCELGICQIGLCEGTFANCDFNPANGCESDLATDVNDCGRCGNRCDLPNAIAECEDGACIVGECEPGWGDCDGLNENGCEVNLDDDPDHCGRCGLQCLLNNADAACVEGTCQIDACDTNFGDCDLFPLNGCEVNLTSSDDDCGACDFDCSLRVGPETVCVDRTCEVRDCLGTTRDCDGDIGNGCEVDVSNDLSNCGGCGTVCSVPNATEQCVAGECGILDCAPGFVDCDGSYATGCEVNVNADPRNCGVCDNNCDLLGAEEVCLAGTCAIGDCQGSNEDCNGVIGDGCEANLAIDPFNCGNCGEVCDLPNTAEVCSGGFCAIGECLGNWWDCNGVRTDGCEVNLANDVNNCGGCGVTCDGDDALSVCIAGFCQVAACEPGRGDCDTVESNGCEVDLEVDINNCGGCGEVCNPANAAPVCDDGLCEILSCIGDFEDCNLDVDDGCESNLNSSLDHCGACGSVCDLPGADERCSFGSCVFLGCQDGFIDLNSDTTDGCEYACSPVPGVTVDLPDPLFQDTDCDGVDGELERAIFVSRIGSDLNSGLRPDVPVASLSRALVIAGALSDRDQILIATGSYSASSTIELTTGITSSGEAFEIHGGYNNDFTARSAVRPTITSSASVAVRASGLARNVLIYGVDFETTAGTETRVGSIVMQVLDSNDSLTLQEVDLVAAAGADGADGDGGADGSNGIDGRNASGASAGGGGSLGGGSGGQGRRRNTGLSGSGGSANGSACGGGGGGGGDDTGCFDGNPPGGRSGTNGCTGGAGSDGTGGSGNGTFVGSTWVPASGGDGGDGTNGGGGGGGGAGGGEDCSDPIFGICFFCGTGRGGGGGGGGGGRATGGAGGGGGGASVGIYVRASTVTVDTVSIRTLGGGDGGAGGAGGDGGVGGDGGSGATSSSGSEGDGGNGGDGGDGGDGGCGGGGAGGPSIGVWGSNGAAVRRAGLLTAVVGDGGTGGPSCGIAGDDGASAQTVNVTLFDE